MRCNLDGFEGGRFWNWEVAPTSWSQGLKHDAFKVPRGTMKNQAHHEIRSISSGEDSLLEDKVAWS